MPTLQSDTECFTFCDAVEWLLDSHELPSREPTHERRARYCILQAYRDLPARHNWAYYYRQRLMQTVADYSTGTVVYDHTGGASERLVTLTTGTFPDWAAYGRIVIDDVHYEVDQRLSSTTITLKSDSNPGADVASSTYTLYRNAYPLPGNFRKLIGVWDVEQQRWMDMVDPPRQHQGLQDFYDTPETPWEVCVRATGEFQGGMSLLFGPPPDEARTYDVFYLAAPRTLAIDEYKTGTVAVSSTTVTGSGTTFPVNCAGSVIRFSTTSAPPTSLTGSLGGTDNPFAAQGIIKSRDSATQLTLEEALSVSVSSGSAYVISDPLDIEPGAMLTALLRAAEAEFSIRAGRKDATLKTALAQQALLQAMEADGRTQRTGRRPGYNPFKHTNVTTDA